MRSLLRHVTAMMYRPDFPRRFGSIQYARRHCQIDVFDNLCQQQQPLPELFDTL